MVAKFKGGSSGVGLGAVVESFDRGPYFEEDGQGYVCEGFFLEHGEYAAEIDASGVNWSALTDFIGSVTSAGGTNWFGVDKIQRRAMVSNDNAKSFQIAGTVTTAHIIDLSYGVYCAPVSGAWFFMFESEGLGYIFRSTNQGVNWTQVHGSLVKLVDIVEFDNGVIIAVGQQNGAPRIFRSTNGGANFTQVYSPTVINPLSSVAVNSSGKAIALASNMPALVSVDFGLTWDTLAISVSFNQPFRIASDNGNVFIISTNNSAIPGVRSEDGGVTWSVVKSLSQSASLATDKQGRWISSSGAVIQRSLDGGKTFATMHKKSASQATSTSNSVETNGLGAWVVTNLSFQAIRSNREFGVPREESSANIKRYVRAL